MSILHNNFICEVIINISGNSHDCKKFNKCIKLSYTEFIFFVIYPEKQNIFRPIKMSQILFVNT